MDQDGADLNSHSIDNLLYEPIARGTITPGRGGEGGREEERGGRERGGDTHVGREGEREREREREREMQKSDENSGQWCTLG